MFFENIDFLLVQRILFAQLLAFPRCLVAHAPSVEACTTLSCECLNHMVIVQVYRDKSDSSRPNLRFLQDLTFHSSHSVFCRVRYSLKAWLFGTSIASFAFGHDRTTLFKSNFHFMISVSCARTQQGDCLPKYRFNLGPAW